MDSGIIPQMADREPPVNLFLYHLLKWLVVNPLFLTYWQGRVVGMENVPRTGSVIVVSNHASNFDPPLLSNSVRRPVAFMAKEELFRVPILAPAIRLYGAYPVKRQTADRSAIKAAMQMGEQGWAIGIFLEGTRTPDGLIHHPKRGAALLAAKLNAPLLPVCLWGTEQIEQGALPRSVPIIIRIAPPMPAPESTRHDVLEATTQKCAEVINELHALGSQWHP